MIPREEKYMQFALGAIHKNLLEDLDSEIFNELNLFEILSDLVLEKSINSKYKK